MNPFSSSSFARRAWPLLAMLMLWATAPRVWAQGAALHFDGTTDQVMIPHHTMFNITGDISVETWINTAYTGTQYILTKHEDGIYIGSGITTSGKIEIYLANVTAGWVTSTASVCNGVWHHLAITRSGTTLKIYIDGTLDKTVAVGAGAISTGGSAVVIGARPGIASFVGTMDELRIWNRALSECEIQHNMSCELAGAQTGLVAYYQFNEMSGTSLPDASGNGNTGTLATFALSGTTSNWVSGGGVTTGVSCTSMAAVVAIAASPSGVIAAGTNVTFTATPTNGGGTPTYQWKKNGGNVGSNSDTYADGTLANGDVITCELTSSADACATPATATSSGITMTVCVPATAYNVTGGGSYCYSGGTGVAVGLDGSETGASYQLKVDGTNTGSPMAGTGSALDFGVQTTEGTYTVEATSPTGCLSTMTGSATVTATRDIRYVMPTASGAADGTSWANASASLHNMIVKPLAGACPAEVWVATGTYKPSARHPLQTSGTGTQYYSFPLLNKVYLYGGFAGTETERSQRNPDANVTTLSGDVGTAGVTTDNSCHVVMALLPNTSAQTLIDGFTITGGNASSTLVFLAQGTGHQSKWGAGIYLYSGSNTLNNLRIVGNFAGKQGGGIYTKNSSNQITNCYLANNQVGDNTTGPGGGGIYSSGSSNVINKTVFYNNIVSSTLFPTAGGGVYATGGTHTWDQLVVYGNQSTYGVGGGIYASSGTTVLLTNSSVVSNKAEANGQGLEAPLGSMAIKNCLFYLNTDHLNQNLMDVDYSTTQTALHSRFYYWGYPVTSTNTSENPMLADINDPDGPDDIWFTADDGLRPLVCSPCVNTGDNSAVVQATDVVGNPRIYGSGTVDMGAYEFQAPSVRNTPITTTGGGVSCTGGTGAPVRLATSDAGANYQLKFNGSDTGAPLVGTGSSLAMPAQTAVGSYTIQATSATGCVSTMPGTVTVVARPNTPDASVPLIAAASYTEAATSECPDGTWTHYYAPTGELMLSIQKNGNAIGTVGDPGFSVNASTTPTWSATTAAAIPSNNNYVTNPGWKVMNRWWNVTPVTQPTTDVQVRTYYTQTDLDGLRVASGDPTLTHEELRFFKINGAGNDPNPANGHANIPSAAGYDQAGYWQYAHGASAGQGTWASNSLDASKFYAEYTVASFSGGGGGGSFGGGGAYPVEWLSFEATSVGKDVLLNWITASEQNNAFFTTERSTNGLDFEAIGSVSAAGNSSSPTSYTYTDATLPAVSTLHYRIRQTDVDGSSSHSEVRTVTLDRASGLMAWPNPVANTLSVQVPADVYSITLADAAGRTVRTATTDGQPQTLGFDLSNLAAGVYTLRAGTASIRVVKK